MPRVIQYDESMSRPLIEPSTMTLPVLPPTPPAPDPWYSFSEEDRRQVLQDLTAGLSEEDAAAHLALNRFLLTVRKIKRDSDNLQAVREPPRRRFHVFAVPGPNNTKEHPYYTQFRVQEQDRAAFAKAHGVSEKDLLRVASGELEQAGGVRQGNTIGTLDIRRPKKPAKRHNLPEWDISGMNEKHLDGPFVAMYTWEGHKEVSDQPATPVYYQVQDFTPNA